MSEEVELMDMELLPDDRSLLRRAVQYLADSCFKTPLRIGGMLCLWVLCFSIIGWNLQQLSLVDEVTRLERDGYAREDRLGRMRAKLSDMDLQQVADDIVRADEVVFQGFPVLAAWTELLRQRALEKDILLDFVVLPARPSAVTGILEVPLTINFKAGRPTADTLFMASLGLADAFVHDQWHVDVIAVQARGGGQGATEVEMGIEVWVRDRYGFLSEEMLAQVPQEQEQPNW
ncbi:MAG: hypothetical protein AAF513_00365 [Pseudomonadota bacterium]